MPLLAAAVIAQHWDEHTAWMREHWHQGQHFAGVGPSGEGKTTYMGGLLKEVRDYVLALDLKGGDTTLSAFGFERVTAVPPVELPRAPWRRAGVLAEWRMSKAGRQWEQIYRRIDAGQPARVIVGGPARTRVEFGRLRQLIGDGIEFARACGNWTVYVDEFELATSMRLSYRIGPVIEEMLIIARDAGISVATSFQAPAWVSHHAMRQARFAVMYATGSRKMIQNVAEEMGRDWRQLAEAVDALPQFFALVIPRGKNGGPMMLVRAPKAA